MRMNIGRPLEFNPDEVLDKAMRVFWRQGYEATSLQDLLTAMSLSKSSFYQTFTSKHELFQRCIYCYREQLVIDLRNKLANAQTARRFISSILYDVATETRGPEARIGCLLMNAANEFGQTDSKIARLVSDGIRASTDILEVAVKKAQNEKDIPENKNAKTLASYLMTNMGGLRNMVKAGADGETVISVANVALEALD